MSIRFDGHKAAQVIYEKIRSSPSTSTKIPSLAILYSKKTPTHQTFTKRKQDTGRKLGFTVDLIDVSENTTTEKYLNALKDISPDYDGILVQLPLPESIDRFRILNAIPPEKDVEGLSHHHMGKLVQQDHEIVSPVSKACFNALTNAADALKLNLKDLCVAFVGNSYLIGRPLSLILARTCNRVTMTNHQTNSLKQTLFNIDVIISGTGIPQLITPDMIQSKAIVIDAGYEKQGTMISGDVHPDVEKKAAFFTPVPGGIGPLTIAYIFDNLVTLTQSNES